jgi:hypothetical protein
MTGNVIPVVIHGIQVIEKVPGVLDMMADKVVFGESTMMVIAVVLGNVIMTDDPVVLGVLAMMAGTVILGNMIMTIITVGQVVLIAKKLYHLLRINN